MPTPNVEVLEMQAEEQPVFFEFKKDDFVLPWPGMADLNYDPFPDKQMEDVVRREIICRERILYAKIKGPDAHMYKRGFAFEHDGHRFEVMESAYNFGTQIADVTAEDFQSKRDPMAILAKLREFYAAGNTR